VILLFFIHVAKVTTVNDEVLANSLLFLFPVFHFLFILRSADGLMQTFFHSNALSLWSFFVIFCKHCFFIRLKTLSPVTSHLANSLLFLSPVSAFLVGTYTPSGVFALTWHLCVLPQAGGCLGRPNLCFYPRLAPQHRPDFAESKADGAAFRKVRPILGAFPACICLLI